MVDIMTALATASQALKLTQELRGIDKAVDAAEFKLKIADLTGALSDIKLALTEAKEELVSKDTEIANLKKQFQRSAEMVEVKGFRYKKGEDGKPKGKPYCPVCEQKLGQFYHLTRLLGKDVCPNCKAVFHLVTGYPE
jgi:DNA repair exonuclease SbcCD ATPase subunit